MIITYKTDATTSVTEQFIGSAVSAWATDTNWKNVGSEGGNKILDWNTDVATTRKQVPFKERKAGMQISYNHPDKGWVNEQYINNNYFNDPNWILDSNWKQILFSDAADEIHLELSETINDLKSQVVMEGYIPVYKNGWIQPDGTIRTFTGDNYIYIKDFVFIEEGETSIKYEGSPRGIAGVCFYGEDKKTVISYYTSESSEETEIDIPEGAKYYRASSLNGILKINGKKLNETKFDGIYTRIDTIENWEDDLVRLKSQVRGSNYYTTLGGNWLSDKGIISSYPNNPEYIATIDYIPISDEEKEILYEGNSRNGSSIAFYDSDKVFISSVKGSNQTVQIPEGAKYYRAGTMNGILKINGKSPNETRIEVLENKVASLSILNGDIICAGDSLTVGYNGASNSYPQQIQAKFPLCKVINKGANGWQASGLLPQLCNMADKQNYYGAPSTTLDYTNVIAVIINMGTNGGVSGSITDIPSVENATDSEGEPLGYINVNAAIDGTLYYNSQQIATEEDYWNLFADNWYGNVSLAIEYIQWKNPKVQIFLVNPAVSSFTETSKSGSEKIAEAMIELADMYGVIFIDMRKIGVNRRNQNLFRVDTVHGTNQRNEMYGKYIANMISQYLKV